MTTLGNLVRLALGALALAGLVPGAKADDSGRKLSLAPPLMGVTVDPAVAPPGVLRKITVAGTWPTGCTPMGATLGLPMDPDADLGVVLTEPFAFVACTQVQTPYRFDLEYTPVAAGQQDILVMTNRATALGRGRLVTGDAQAPRARYDVSGAWFDAQSIGSGVMISHDFGATDQIFSTWEIYDAGTGGTRWLTAQQGTWSADGLAWKGLLYETKADPASCDLCPLPLAHVTFRGVVRFTFALDGASGGLDAAFDLLPADGPPQRLSNLRRFLPDRVVIGE